MIDRVFNRPMDAGDVEQTLEKRVTKNSNLQICFEPQNIEQGIMNVEVTDTE